MKAYVLELVCPDCNAELVELNQTIGRTHAIGITKCQGCAREFVLSIHIRNRMTDGQAQRPSGFSSQPDRQVYA